MERIKAEGLTADAVKWVAIAAMLIDHIAWGFVPLDTALGQVMHIIGRITAPTMCFFIAEGYAHTRNIKRYALRLGTFAVLSQVPFTLFQYGSFRFAAAGRVSEVFSVIYTLFLSLLAVWAWDTIRSRSLRTLAVIGLCILALPGDWMFIDIMFTLVFWIYRGDFKNQAIWFTVFTTGMVAFFVISSVLSGRPAYNEMFQVGVLLCLPLLRLYNGERGGGRSSKWTFYVFYPAHLLVLGLFRLWF